MKDPAVLFYTADFIAGTLTMTDEQRGQYILLLCLQHQKGYLTEKDMLNICKTYDEDIWCKFIANEGKYYNERMKNEAEKRKRYSESRRQNRMNKEEEEKSNNKKGNNISKTYVPHMVNENININESNNTIPDFEKFKSYALEKEPNINLSNLKHKYEAWKEDDWHAGKPRKKIRNWKTTLLNTLQYLGTVENNTHPSHKTLRNL